MAAAFLTRVFNGLIAEATTEIDHDIARINLLVDHANNEPDAPG